MAAVPQSSSPVPVKWDVLLFIRNAPVRVMIQGDNIRMISPDGEQKDALPKALGEFPEYSEIRPFVEVETPVMVLLRVEAVDKQKAASSAWSRLGHWVDAVALSSQGMVKVCPAMVIRREHENCGDIGLFSPEALLSWKAKTADDDWQRAWNDRNNKVLELVFPFVEHVLEYDVGWEAMSALERQILHSVRLFRKGEEAGSFPVQFLCKFAALEGLVLEPYARDKGKKLKARIGRLFKDATWAEKAIGDMWKKRGVLVHEARAEVFPQDKNACLYGLLVEDLTILCQACFVFAWGNRSACRDVLELWENAPDRYELPAVFYDRAAAFKSTSQAIEMFFSRGSRMPKVGAWMDQVWATPVMAEHA